MMNKNSYVYMNNAEKVLENAAMVSKDENVTWKI